MMATSFDSTSRPHPSTDLDLDMMLDPAHVNDDIDFNIDIEFDASQANQDIDVQDAPQETNTHYDDEIMYEEDDGTFVENIAEVEMEENHDADLHMDETVYHEAHSELNLDSIGDESLQQYGVHSLPGDNTVMSQLKESVNSTAQAAENLASFNPLTTSKYATTSTAAQIPASGANFIEALTGVSDNGSSVTEHATTAAPSDVTGNELNAEASDPEILAAVKLVSGSPEAALNEAGSSANAQNDEINYDSDVEEEPLSVKDENLANPDADEQVADTQEDATGNHEEYDNEDYSSLDQKVDGETQESTEHDSEEQATASRDNADETHAEYNDDQFDSFAYNAIVQYEEHSMALFPPHSDGLPVTYLLQEARLAESPLSELFEACRVTLADSINSDSTLCIEVPGLKLSLSEGDSDCSNVTLSQIIDVYHHLHSNEEMYEPEAIHLDVVVRPKPSVRLTQLFKAAEEGKGFSMISTETVKVGDEDKSSDGVAVSNEENDEEYLEEWNDENEEDYVEKRAQEGNEEATELEATELKEASDANNTKSHEEVDSNPQVDVDAPPESEEEDNFPPATLLINDPPAQLDTENLESASADTVDEVQEDFDADDLIDYSDDDEEPVEPSRSPTMQADQSAGDAIPRKSNTDDNASTPVPVMESTKTEKTLADDEDFFLEFDNVDDSITENQSVAQVAPTSDLDETRDDGLNAVPDTDDYLNLDLDFGNDSAHPIEGKDGNIDFNLEEPTSIEGANSQEATKPHSPAGKRNYDEHVADSELATSEHDPKRVRSDG